MGNHLYVSIEWLKKVCMVFDISKIDSTKPYRLFQWYENALFMKITFADWIRLIGI